MNNKSASKSFNFLDLDNRLNTKKIQQTKKEQKQKNILNIYQKKLPNFQLINQCDKVLLSYKNHYNNNRRFNLFYEEKERQNEKQIQYFVKKQIKEVSTLKDAKFQSKTKIENLESAKSLSLFQAERIMKPIKSNQYLNQKGIVLLPLYRSKSISSYHKLQQKPKVGADLSERLDQRSKSYRISANFSQRSLYRKLSSEKPILKLSQQKNQVNDKNLQKISIKRRKKLMYMFRQNVQLIICKLKMMKLSFSQLLESKIFDKSIPYKFGEQIFHSIKEGNEPKVFRTLMQKRLSIFSYDTTGKTTLIWACIRGYDKIAQLLLSNGVQPHAKDMNGQTALYYAIKYNHVNCAKILFICSYRLQEDLQKQNMSVQMRKMLRIGFSSHKFLKKFDTIGKKKEHFEHEYKYYFKE